ncbi:hypothetical protein GUJ93_ZPchr0002g23714 [Zizania palustris]|uniref:Uncharacterized protein n=1 Tax=Zizania palustris TaxID=103762 RepID=A0A8J5VW09_ZIZPA|nr:hypothetical protein GUJ93_ZPchr0002g23714 [Zizania palustris]
MENGSGGSDVPEHANEHCPGTQSEAAGKADACAGCPNQQICATAPKGPDPEKQDYLFTKLTRVHRTIPTYRNSGPVSCILYFFSLCCNFVTYEFCFVTYEFCLVTIDEHYLVTY